MDKFIGPWCSWCRLCAKEDPENNVNVHFISIHKLLEAGEDVKLPLKDALDKYFSLHLSYEDGLPQHVCPDCYTLMTSIMLFNRRVERIQQMYFYLMENPVNNPSELKSIRLQFKVTNDEAPGCPQNESFSVNNLKKEESSSVDWSVVEMKEETCYAETHSEFETSRELASELLYPQVELCDEEHSSLSHEDPLQKDNSGKYLRNDAKSTKKTSKTKKKGISGMLLKPKKNVAEYDSKFKLKKFTTEDFQLDAECTECNKKCNTYSSYCEHMKVVHGYTNTDKRWRCPVCDRTFMSKFHFERHMRIHMPLESRKTIKCPECDNRYSTNLQLESHISHKHRNDKPFICEECGVRVSTNSNLRQHMLTHTDDAPFECEVCKKKFKDASRLKTHMDIHNPNKHVCGICGLQLNSRATLNRHFLVHSDEKQHKCDYCGRSFKRSKTLKTHLLLHTGLKPYSCDFCERTFVNGSNCRTHMKKMHTAELAVLEASGAKAHTQNIPKLEKLKSLTKTVDPLML